MESSSRALRLDLMEHRIHKPERRSFVTELAKSSVPWGTAIVLLFSVTCKVLGESPVWQPSEYVRVAQNEQPPVTPPGIGPLPPPVSSELTVESNDLPFRYARTRFTSLLNQNPVRRNFRSASIPSMFGDFFGPDIQFTAIGFLPGQRFLSDVTLGGSGAGSRLKIGENNHASPTDRVYFMYQHFHNTIRADADPTLGQNLVSFSTNRYVIGLERTLLDGFWSVAVQTSFNGEHEFINGPFGVEGDSMGNLAIILKRLLFQSNSLGLSAGIGINTPTGSDAATSIDTELFVVRNNAVHLVPFVAFASAPSNTCFYQGFVQLDMAANGNRIEFSDKTVPAAPTTIGFFNDQNLLHADFMAGVWLLSNPGRSGLTALSIQGELHYTTTLQDTDSVAFATPNRFSTGFGNSVNRLDIFNFTCALQGEIANNTDVRFGAVFPLSKDNDRLFDSEFQVQINRRF